jgi:hypothetical protein
MSDNIHRFPKQGGGASHGGGPEDPMIEHRVGRLEEDAKDIKASLRAIDGKLNSIEVSLAEIKGRVSQAPTWLQLIGAVLATWAAGAAIVFTLLRAVRP